MQNLCNCSEGYEVLRSTRRVIFEGEEIYMVVKNKFVCRNAECRKVYEEERKIEPID